MKKVFFTLAFLLISIVRTEAQQWNLVWSDEFSNTTINTANWVFETGAGGWGNNELENYTNRPVNASIYNGNLIIVGKEENYQGSNYTSARLKTQGKQSWTYGKVEARIKMPISKGLWPAFWMLGNNIDTVSWPGCGEIDIMEHINTDSTIYGTMHWNNSGTASYGGNTLINSVTQYHIYSVEWDSSAIKWMVDGNQYWTGNIANNINSTNEFHKPFFILLNMAIGGSWPGNPNGTNVFPDTMFVDYVRVYQNQITTSVKNIWNNDDMIHIYPNPFTSHTIIAFDEEQNKTDVKIMDVLGKEIQTISFTGKQCVIEKGGMSNGIYFVQITEENKNVVRSEIIVQ